MLYDNDVGQILLQCNVITALLFSLFRKSPWRSRGRTLVPAQHWLICRLCSLVSQSLVVIHSILKTLVWLVRQREVEVEVT
jgi:hypothetical protein